MPTKTDSPRMPKTRRYHWYAVLLAIMGTLFPPLAVAARFGIGKDFWINVLLTIAGYIPGHVHNFYIQNVRNNKMHYRTPKWAVRYGLVNDSTIRRHEQRSQWATKYNDRNLDSGYDQQPLEDGQVRPSRTSTHDSTISPPKNGNGLWQPDDESYYSPEHDRASDSGGRWRYVPNLTDSLPGAGDAIAKKKKKKDRWARTEDAYSASGQKKKKKKKPKNRSTVGDIADAKSTYLHHVEPMEQELQEEAAQGTYGAGGEGDAQAGEGNGDGFNHEF